MYINKNCVKTRNKYTYIPKLVSWDMCKHKVKSIDYNINTVLNDRERDNYL